MFCVYEKENMRKKYLIYNIFVRDILNFYYTTAIPNTLWKFKKNVSIAIFKIYYLKSIPVLTFS